MNIEPIYFGGVGILLLIILIPYLAYSQSQNTCLDVSFKEITTTYDILIPFSTTNISIFEPNEISIPVNTMVRWINFNNYTYNISLFPEKNNTDRIEFDIQALGGSYSHNFSKPGVYTYFNIDNKIYQGKITVGDTIQKGKFTTMTMGTNLPVKTSELQRRTILIEPNFETTGIQVPKNSPIQYNFTIVNPVGTPIYNKEIIDVDGRLYVELIPFPSKISIRPLLKSNLSEIGVPGAVSKMEEIGTQAEFVTWGLLDNLNNDTNNNSCLKDILRVQGPVLVEFIKNGIKYDKPYSIEVSILQHGYSSLYDKNYNDTFILPIL